MNEEQRAEIHELRISANLLEALTVNSKLSDDEKRGLFIAAKTMRNMAELKTAVYYGNFILRMDAVNSFSDECDCFQCKSLQVTCDLLGKPKPEEVENE